MKTVSAALTQHLAGEVTTLATCWQITRRDGVVLGFTDHVRDPEVDGVTYNAASGYTRTAIRGTADLAVDNLDVESVFSGDGVTEEDLRAGQYDFAEVRMFLVNYQDLGQGILKLRRGWLGEATIRDGMYVAELRGMTQRLQMTVGEVYLRPARPGHAAAQELVSAGSVHTGPHARLCGPLPHLQIGPGRACGDHRFRQSDRPARGARLGLVQQQGRGVRPGSRALAPLRADREQQGARRAGSPGSMPPSSSRGPTIWRTTLAFRPGRRRAASPTTGPVTGF